MHAQAVLNTGKEELKDFVNKMAAPGAGVYTDSSSSYRSLEAFQHAAVNHSSGEYVRGKVSTNGIESFWALFQRGLYGIFHHLSMRHLQRYLQEFCGRSKLRNLDTAEQMRQVALGLRGRRLTWAMLAGRAAAV